MLRTTLILGPILGVEGNTDYSVVVLIEAALASENLQLMVHEDGVTTAASFPALPAEKTASYVLRRFSFQVALGDSTREIHYSIRLGDRLLENDRGETSWTFVVPGRSVVPKIGFASCNGHAAHWPSELPRSSFHMWRKLLNMHRQEDEESGPLGFAFHGLLLGGDQVYADTIWKSVPYLANRRFIRFRRSRFVRRHRIAERDLPMFRAQVEAYYERLYIESFGQDDVSAVLARIPSSMMWDDHDIFDGWGSYPGELQNSQIFKEIFAIASRYFELFQLRTRENASQMSRRDFSQHYRFRNFEIFLLDNRTHRNQHQIMSDAQYQSLGAFENSGLFHDLEPALDAERVLLMVVPVPVAHLNYKARAESLLARLLTWQLTTASFTKSFEDDVLDHWSHENHKDEQRRFIDTVYAIADANNPKYVHLVSGDVHCAGSGRIERTSGTTRYVNQLVSSPIVYPPAGGLVQRVLASVSDDVSEIEGYRVGVDRFGVDAVDAASIFERNFGFLYKAKRSGLKFYLSLEKSDGEYAWDQPRKYNPSKKRVRRHRHV